MIGRRVKSFWGEAGVVSRWEPLNPGSMCDALVLHDDGKECWHASRSLRPIDGLGDLPSRDTVRLECAERQLRDLRSILEKHIEDLPHVAEKWRYMRFGYTHIGNALVGAIREVEGDITALGRNRKLES